MEHAIARGTLPSGTARNGMPVGRPYAWRGLPGPVIGGDAELRARIAASDTAGPGPGDIGWEWYRERALENGEPVPPAAPPPAPERCGTCGYLTTRCCCPGGPRG